MWPNINWLLWVENIGNVFVLDLQLFYTFYEYQKKKKRLFEHINLFPFPLKFANIT